ncbi:MAG: lysophospholipid acyltransferase family protein [Syntrophales bacterium]|nr:lysophospholipid acyltransferase family protein [Syntrophales bacterium]
MIKQLSRVALRLGLIPFAVYLLRLYFYTVKHTMINDDVLRRQLEGGGKGIAALWHQRILLVLPAALSYSVYEPSVLISQSRDGDIIAEVYKTFRFRPIRGSSSRGGREGLRAIIADLATHSLVAHVLDGPRGPRGVIKPGLVRLAQLSQAPVFPVYASVDKAWVLNSWDAFIVPKPFSKIVTRFGEPIYVPQNLDESSFERIRLEIEKLMLENQRRDDAMFGWENLI